MARLIGTVRQVVGEVLAVSANGEQRLLQAGDRLYAGEYLQTGTDGAIAVRLESGGELTLGRYSRVLLDGSILEGHAAHVETLDPLTPTLSDAQAEKPVSTEPRAEAAPIGESGGGHTMVVLSETGGEVTPVIGFPTEGLSMAPIFPDGRDEFFDEGSDGPPPLVVPPPQPPVIEPPVVEPPVIEPPVIDPPPIDPPVEPPTEPPCEPPCEPPVDHDVTVSESGVTVDEAHLPEGSAPDASKLTQNGTFTVNAPDGLQSLTVGGVEVIKGGVVATFPQTALTPLGNSFSITGYDPATGQVSYSYTLNGSLEHPEGDGTNSLGESIDVVAVDSDGDTGSANLEIVIVDDVPQACDIEVCVTSEPGPSDGFDGSLLSGGTFGADDGFVKSICVDGITYNYDPEGKQPISGGDGSECYDSLNHTLTVITGQGGTLVVNMQNGAFNYTPGEVAVPLTERIGFVLSDSDGDQAGASLLINVQPNLPPPAPEPCVVAADDHIITNVLAPVIELPAAVLLANDHFANDRPLTATPTRFETGWTDAAGDFLAPTLHPVAFNGHRDNLANQLKDLQRADFHVTSAATAMVMVNGYLSAWDGHSYNSQDLYSVELKAGETLKLDTSCLSDQVGLAWQMNDGPFHSLGADASFTATEDNVYRVLLVHQPDPGAVNEGLEYKLGLTVDYSAVDTTPTWQGAYTAHGMQGGSDTAQVSIDYQHGPALIGGAGDDVLLAGNGSDCLYGHDGADLLIGGKGNDLLTGGAGADTFMWLVGDTGHDRVTDFAFGVAKPGIATSGDTLDLSQLLHGIGATAETLDDFLRFRVSGSAAETVSTIEVGHAAGHPVQTIDLAGVDLAAQFGVTPGNNGWIAGGADTSTIINGMLGDHSLKTDVV
ncbi:retention module-containing protein [Pseudomonas sp. R1-18]|uniref:retention module-containing protein n=1 Tax=Pseudomonas sp. R1-18 TaxID=1632772 RepID=UPI003DA7C117